MQGSKILLMLWISLIIIAWGKNDGFSQVYVTVPDVKAEQDSTILVPVLVSDLSNYNIIAYQFKVLFDSLVVKAKGVSSKNTLTEPWGNAVSNSDSAGKMMVGAFGISALTAGDTLLNLVFKVIAKPGNSTPIILKDVRFNNGNPTSVVDNGLLEIMVQSGVAGPDPVKTMPQTMQLLYNYPEPFQDRTSIVVNLTQSAPVEIEIFNILGQNIRHLGIDLITGSQVQIDWNTTDNHGDRVPPGMYFCVVKQGNKILAVDRMILVN